MNTCQTPFPKSASTSSSDSSSQRLIEALGRLQEQASNTVLGSVYIYDLVEQRTLCASCSVAALLGYTADAIHGMGPIGLASLIHPDDLHLVSEHYQRFTTLCPGEVITIDYRMRRTDGAWCWLRSEETPVAQASDGFPLQILGIIQVIPQPSSTHTRKLTVSSKFIRRRKLSPITLTRLKTNLMKHP